MHLLRFSLCGVVAIGGAAALAIAGCSSVDLELHDDPMFESGTRLRAKVFDGGDGAVVFERWFDSELGVDCDQRLATDGAERCLPAMQPGFAYLDAGCADPVVAFDACAGPTPKMITKADYPEGCAAAPPAIAYEVGAAVTPEVVYFLDASTGSCSSAAPGNTTYFRRGAVVPPEKFVALEVVDEPIDEALARRVQRADDGAWRGMTVVDRKKNAPCVDYLWTYDGAYGEVCVAGTPLLLTQSFHQYTDAACTTDADVVEIAPPSETCGLVPDVVLDFAFTADECDVHYDIRKVGPTTSPTTPLYGGPPSECAPAEPPAPGNALYTIDEVIPPTSLPSLRVRRIGSGAVRVPVWADDEDRGLVTVGGFERPGGVACYFYRLGGALRCIDPMPVDLPRFADASCTKRVVVTYTGSAACPRPPQTMAGIVADTVCGSFQELAEVVALGDAVPATQVFERTSDGSCLVSLIGEDTEVRAIGATVDATTFPVVVERTE